MMSRIVRRLGHRRTLAAVKAVGSVLILIGAGAATIALVAQEGGWSDARAAPLHVQQFHDADGDGLADAIENRIGSRVDRADTLGGNVSDGWLYHWFGNGLDWNQTDLLDRSTLVPPPTALPVEQRENRFTLPTLRELYEIDRQRLDTEGDTGAWWRDPAALDPLRWDNDDDQIADAWLISFGLHPSTIEAEGPAPGDSAMTIREKYRLGLDPVTDDSDGDGLLDVEEISGFASLGVHQVEFEATDPLAFSTRGDEVADGYLVRTRLDPHDPAVAASDPAGDGLSVREAFRITVDHCENASEGTCDLRERLIEGTIVDPTVWDSFEDGTPDAWDARDPHGIAHPLHDARTTQVYDTTDWDSTPWNGEAQPPRGVVIDEHNPLPDPFPVTIFDLYAFLRPADWREPTAGPWTGGLPTKINTTTGSLPPAVALRGWTLEVDTCLGCNDTQPSIADNRRIVHAWADPRKADSDGDGLTDVQEYFGINSDGHTVPRTNPNDPDSDGDGLPDHVEIEEATTDPMDVDTSGSFLTDGKEWDYWTGRKAEAEHLRVTDLELANQQYSWLTQGHALTAADVDRLGPMGILDGTEPNVLSADSDGDGIPNGAELFPNLFLGQPTLHARPATDPARIDSDGDGLPDDWELRWSKEQFHGCAAPCTAPDEVHGWPIDPSCWNSLDLATCDHPIGPGPTSVTDAEINLAGDEVNTAPGDPPRAFTNGLAFLFNLHPFLNDTDRDGIQDMFAIHWGVENVPSWVPDEVDLRSGPGGDLDWVVEITNAIAGTVLERGAAEAPEAVVIHPARTAQNVTTGTNILGLFTDRNKGTWVVHDSDGPGCVQELPHTGSTLHAFRETYEDAAGIPSRAGLHAPCWRWVDHDVGSDQRNGTDPWRHDFDSDGLPDAWEAHYSSSQSLFPHVPSEASLATGCRSPERTSGLPPPADGDHCLSYIESYAYGVDPRANDVDHVGDTDGGGLVDWLEVALGLDPLDPLDDHGDEDWDGDGLLNWVEDELGTSRLSPDTDGDGLLDGDWRNLRTVPFFEASNGDGNLCLRRGSDNVTAAPDGTGGMENRPPQANLGSGNLTHSQRFDLFQSLGLLSDSAPGGRCPSPVLVDGVERAFVLFKREVAVQQVGNNLEIRGAGEGSDPLRWDTSGDGIPDGWLVFWRDGAGNNNNLRASLDPNQDSAQSDVDLDVPTGDEYMWGRPLDWDEARDGPWWGGTSPTTRDSDGDKEWFASIFSSQDGIDDDNDADGLPLGLDPFPGVDNDNDAIVSWNSTSQRYETDFLRLWPALLTRSDAHARDTDGDGVPDWIDRARVKIIDLAAKRGGTPISSLVKDPSEEPFMVAGRVLIQESPRSGVTYEGPATGPAASNGDAVAGATVKAILAREGSNAVVGVGFTDDDGRFEISSSILGSTPPAIVPTHAIVEGSLYMQNEVVSIAGGAADLSPGPAVLFVVVEPNDPGLQPLQFRSATTTFSESIAFKDVGQSASFQIPDALGEPGSALQGAILDPEAQTPQPDRTIENVRHSAAAIFAARSAGQDLTIKATSTLSLSVQQTEPRASEVLNVTGNLMDSAEVPLPGRTVQVSLSRDFDTISTTKAVVDGDGRLEVAIPTMGLDPGTYLLVGKAELLDTDTFLVPPDPVKKNIVLSQSTVWNRTLLLNGVPILDGQSIEVDIEDPISVNAVLFDGTTGEPVGQRGATLHLTSATTGDAILPPAAAATDSRGRLDVTLDAIDAPITPAFLRLDVHADAITPQDDSATATIFLQPRFATSLRLENATGAVGQETLVSGTLERVGPGTAQGVSTAPGVIEAVGPDGERLVLPHTTNDEGKFVFPVVSSIPGQQKWTFRFNATDDTPFIQDSPPSHAWVTHVAATELQVEAEEGLVGEEVAIGGRLTTVDGAPVPSQNVTASWKDSGDAVTAETDKGGNFSLVLPARDSAGEHTLDATFAGTMTYEPSATDGSTLVRLPTILNATSVPATVSPVGGDTGGIELRLMDQKANPLAGRNLEIHLTHPLGTTHEVERITDGDGTVHLDANEIVLDAPGSWNVTATYGGGPLDAGVKRSFSWQVTHDVAINILRMPGSVSASDINIIGRLDAVGTGHGPIEITVTSARTTLATTTTTTNENWSIQVPVDQLGPGTHELEIVGSGGPHVRVMPTNATLVAAAPVRVSVVEAEGADGGRVLTFQAEGIPASANGSVSMSVIRADLETGEVVGTHELVLDANGHATLRLQADESGSIHVVALSEPMLMLDDVDYTSPQTLTSGNRDALSVAGWVLATLAAAGVISVIAVYIVWRRRHAAMFAAALMEARAALQDSSASPALIIRRAYQALLEVLTSAGYTVRDTATVRDIAHEATDMLRLPQRPMETMTVLFETAVFSTREMGAMHRSDALAALDELLQRLDSPLASGRRAKSSDRESFLRVKSEGSPKEVEGE